MFKHFFLRHSIWTSQAEQLHLQFMKMMIKKLTLLLFFSLTLSNAQEQNEHAPPDFIKSVQFRGGAQGYAITPSHGIRGALGGASVSSP